MVASNGPCYIHRTTNRSTVQNKCSAGRLLPQVRPLMPRLPKSRNNIVTQRAETSRALCSSRSHHALSPPPALGRWLLCPRRVSQRRYISDGRSALNGVSQHRSPSDLATISAGVVTCLLHQRSSEAAIISRVAAHESGADAELGQVD